MFIDIKTKIDRVVIGIIKTLKFEQKQSFDNDWPDIKREYADPNRPGLIFVVPSRHVFLCPFEVDKLQKEWDEKHSAVDENQRS